MEIRVKTTSPSLRRAAGGFFRLAPAAAVTPAARFINPVS